MVVGIKVIAENVKQGHVKHTNTCYFTMVAKDEEGNTVTVPPLILESKEEVRRFVESIQRKELKFSSNEEMEKAKSALSIESALEILNKQRCEVRLE